MKITQIRLYDGARKKITRLGLAELFLQLLEMILGTPVTLEERKQINGAAAVRQLIDDMFAKVGGWKLTKAGGVDWVKTATHSELVQTTLGVEVQISARSDLLVRDVVHLRNSIEEGVIDVGVIIVPDDRMQAFLPDRTPRFSDAVRYIELEFREATKYPLVLIAVEHDGTGIALAKRKRTS
jgi:hypothetical protein